MMRLDLFSRFSKKEIVAIELGTANYKIVACLKQRGLNQITSVISNSIAGANEDVAAKSIQESVKKLKLKNPFFCISIPSSLLITKNIEVPSTDPAEIKNIINLQAGRHTPYSREEIIVDHIDIGIYKQNYTKILLLIVNNNTIKKQFSILEKAAIKIDKVLLAQEGAGTKSSKMFGIAKQAAPASVINIDEQVSDFFIIWKNRTIFIRSIPIGRQHLTAEKDKYEKKFAEEVKKSQEAYLAENIDKNPDSIVLTGALSGLDSIDIALNQQTGLPVKTCSYISGINLSQESKSSILELEGLSFFNAIACACAFDDSKVNLIPEEIRIKKALAQRGRDLVISGFLFLTILVLVFLMLISKIYFRSLYLKNLDMQYKKTISDAKALEDVLKRNSIARSYLLGRGMSFLALAELYEIAPLNIELSNIRFEKEGKFTLKGTADSMSTVFSFVDGLSKSKYFTEIKTRDVKKRQEEKKDVTDFEVIISLKKF